LIVVVFNSGLTLASVNGLYQPIALGILVIAAVGVDQWIRRVKA
jgi:fructose transport system permease protein